MSGSMELGPFYAHPFLPLKVYLIGIIKDQEKCVIRLPMSGLNPRHADEPWYWAKQPYFFILRVLTSNLHQLSQQTY